MKVEGFAPYAAEHCETSAMGHLLQHAGIRLSEPMLFGLGQGLGFIYWDSKAMDFPFIGGRTKPDTLSAAIASRLGLRMNVQETSSADKAWHNVRSCIERGVPVGLKLDSYYLDYFTSKVHFAAHYAVIYGMDDAHAYMADTRQQGGLVRTRLSSLAEARAARGPMSSRQLSFTIERADPPPSLEPAARTSIANNARDYLNPPIRNMGYAGIEKMSRELLKWPSRSRDRERDFGLTALLMERGGTGGALFRNLYRDFLRECAETFGDDAIGRAALLFADIAPMWSDVSALIERAGRAADDRELREASGLLTVIAAKERAAMELLQAAAGAGGS